MFFYHKNKLKGQEETFGGDVSVYGIDCGNGFTAVYSSLNSSRTH